MAKFSVVIAVFNKEAYVEKTIQSVLGQTVQDFEIIIINDGSTDGSELIIKKFTDDRINYYYQENKGVSAARNSGIKKATATYIAFLDADDVWLPHHLESIEAAMTQYSNDTIFSTAMELKIGNGYKKAPYSIPKDCTICRLNYFEASMQKSILHSSTLVVKKELFKKCGSYNESYKTGEDTDLYIRLGIEHAVIFNNTATVRYTIDPKGLNISQKTLEGKAPFYEYDSIAETNKPLKKFLDINRFSLCLIAKQENSFEMFKKLRSTIDMNNLNTSQQTLLKLPKGILNMLFTLKKSIARIGLSPTVFK